MLSSDAWGSAQMLPPRSSWQRRITPNSSCCCQPRQCRWLVSVPSSEVAHGEAIGRDAGAQLEGLFCHFGFSVRWAWCADRGKLLRNKELQLSWLLIRAMLLFLLLLFFFLFSNGGADPSCRLLQISAPYLGPYS